MDGAGPEIDEMDGEGGPFNDGALPFVDRRLGPLPDDEMDDVIEICRR